MNTELKQRRENNIGSFSWLRADYTPQQRNNISDGDVYKCLIPKEFGGGFIKDVYEDCGIINYKREVLDLYGILAYWNKAEGMHYDGDTYPITIDEIAERGRTNEQDKQMQRN